MCLTCGCNLPYDDMGDPNNLTYADVKKAMETNDGKDQTTDEGVQNLIEAWKKVKPEDKAYKKD